MSVSHIIHVLELVAGPSYVLELSSPVIQSKVYLTIQDFWKCCVRPTLVDLFSLIASKCSALDRTF
jgi:hypothetical protein